MAYHNICIFDIKPIPMYAEGTDHLFPRNEIKPSAGFY